MLSRTGSASRAQMIWLPRDDDRPFCPEA